MIRKQSNEPMTELEHYELNETGNYFWGEFSKLVAHCCMMHPEDRQTQVLYHLGDMTSVFGSEFDKYTKGLRECLNRNTEASEKRL